MVTKEQREMCEAMCRVVNLATKTFKELGEASGRWAKLNRQEEGDE